MSLKRRLLMLLFSYYYSMDELIRLGPKEEVWQQNIIFTQLQNLVDKQTIMNQLRANIQQKILQQFQSITDKKNIDYQYIIPSKFFIIIDISLLSIPPSNKLYSDKWVNNESQLIINYPMKFLFSTSKILSRPVYIVAAKRTAIGAFNGGLSSFTAPELGGYAIRGALNSINLDPKEVDQVILGNVLGAGVGQAPARQASLKGGLGVQVPCTTVNKVCSSGLKSLVYGAQSIALGQSQLVVAGGFESMSRAPHLLLNARKGLGYGDQKLLDAISHDGLMDSFNKISMGLCAQKTASDFKITREAQDQFCRGSYRKHIEAVKKGLLMDQIVPIRIKQKGKEDQVVSEDQEARRYKEDKISQIPPAFSKTGTITAANASKINDGAVSIILASQEKMKKLGLKPLARIVGYADAQIEPVDFSIAPNYSTKKVLARTGLNISEIDYFEYNEAFSVVCIANRALLDIPAEKINVHGGAVAMGHPIGASGARIVQSLLTIFKSRGGKYGLAGICNGGGGSTAMIIENLQ